MKVLRNESNLEEAKARKIAGKFESRVGSMKRTMDQLTLVNEAALKGVDLKKTANIFKVKRKTQSVDLKGSEKVGEELVKFGNSAAWGTTAEFDNSTLSKFPRRRFVKK